MESLKRKRVNSNTRFSKSAKIQNAYTMRPYLEANTVGLNELKHTVYNSAVNKRLKVTRLIYKNGKFMLHSYSVRKQQPLNITNRRIIWKPFTTTNVNQSLTYYFQIGIVGYNQRTRHTRHAVSAVKRGKILYFIDPAGSTRSIMSDTVANQLKKIVRASKLIMYKGPNLQASNRTAGICVGISIGILRFLSRSMNRTWNQSNLNRQISQFTAGSNEAACQEVYRHLITNSATIRYKK